MSGGVPPVAGLDGEYKPLLVVDLHIEDVHVGNIEDGTGPGASAHPNHT
jgi:hypothetical protein